MDATDPTLSTSRFLDSRQVTLFKWTAVVGSDFVLSLTFTRIKKLNQYFYFYQNLNFLSICTSSRVKNVCLRVLWHIFAHCLGWQCTNYCLESVSWVSNSTFCAQPAAVCGEETGEHSWQFGATDISMETNTQLKGEWMWDLKFNSWSKTWNIFIPYSFGCINKLTQSL